METSVLHRKSNLFVEQNLAHYFLLGLASLSLNLAEQLAQEVQSQTPLSAISETEDDRYLHFLLGLLVTSRKFNQMLATEKKKVDAAQIDGLETAVSQNTLSQLRHLLR